MPTNNPILIARYRERQKEKDRQRYQRLIRLGGGRCVLCGRKEDLSLDHKYGFTGTGRRTIAEYERQFRLGRIRVLCGSCNSSDGNFRMREKQKYKTSDTENEKNF